MLESGWFALNDRQLNLYKRLHKIICIDNKYWYNTYSGIYSDDLISFVALLQFMSHFESADEIKENDFKMLPENFNAFACENLQRHFEMLSNKLPIEPMHNDSKDHFFNQRGAKVYKDTLKQPMLPIKEGQTQYTILSVGFSNKGNPLVTISEKGEAICYRLPNDYCEWAMTMVGLANSGINYFPEEVVFSLVNGKYYADVL